MGVRGSWEFIGRIPGVNWKCGKQALVPVPTIKGLRKE